MEPAAGEALSAVLPGWPAEPAAVAELAPGRVVGDGRPAAVAEAGRGRRRHEAQSAHQTLVCGEAHESVHQRAEAPQGVCEPSVEEEEAAHHHHSQRPLQAEGQREVKM